MTGLIKMRVNDQPRELCSRPWPRENIDNQAEHWSRQACDDDEIFLDPYGPDVVNPLWQALAAIPGPVARPRPTSVAAPERCCPTSPSGSSR